MMLELYGVWVVVGLIAGSLAGYVMQDGGYGLGGDLVLGVIGSLVASQVTWVLGVSPGAGMPVIAVVAFIGAAIVIGGQRRFWTTHA